MGYTVELDKSAKEFIVDIGYDEKFGARPLKRAIQKYVEDPLAEEIIKSNISEGDTICLTSNDEKSALVLNVGKLESKAEMNAKKKKSEKKPKTKLGKDGKESG